MADTRAAAELGHLHAALRGAVEAPDDYDGVILLERADRAVGALDSILELCEDGGTIPAEVLTALIEQTLLDEPTRGAPGE